MSRTGLGSKTTPESKCPELLANYCDMLLRKTPLSKVVTPPVLELYHPAILDGGQFLI